MLCLVEEVCEILVLCRRGVKIYVSCERGRPCRFKFHLAYQELPPHAPTKWPIGHGKSLWLEQSYVFPYTRGRRPNHYGVRNTCISPPIPTHPLTPRFPHRSILILMFYVVLIDLVLWIHFYLRHILWCTWVYMDMTRSSDVDLFVYGLDEKAATKKVRHIFDAVKHANPKVCNVKSTNGVGWILLVCWLVHWLIGSIGWFWWFGNLVSRDVDIFLVRKVMEL